MSRSRLLPKSQLSRLSRRPRKLKPAKRSLRLEPLEDRRLLAVVYVDAGSGNDTLGDGSANTPYATIQRGVDAAAALPGDDAVTIRPGSYLERVMISDTSGAVSLTGITGNPADVSVGEIRPVTSDGLHIEDIGVRGVLWFEGGHTDVVIDNVVSKSLLLIRSAEEVSVTNSKFGVIHIESVASSVIGNVDLIGEGANRGGIFVAGGMQVVIDGARADGGVSNAVKVTGVSDVAIRNVAASGHDLNGIRLESVGDVTIENVVASGNADVGVSINGANNVTLQNIVASENANHGFFTYNVNSVTATNVTAIGNTGKGFSHGALLRVNGPVVINGGEFSGNEHNGLNIEAYSSGVSAQIADVVTDSNGQRGLRAFLRGGPVAIADGSFSSNAIRGVELLSTDGATISRIQISNNGNGYLNTDPSNGGGLYIGAGSGAPILMDDVSVIDNRSLNDGAGIHIASPGESVIRNAMIRGNSNATGSSSGGGIFAGSTYGTLRLQDSVVENNSSIYGGGIWTVGELAIERTSVTGNTAVTNGGGISAVGEGTLVSQSTISGNSAGQNAGGILVRGFSPHIVNSTISGNSSGAHGGGVFVVSGSPTLEWTTIANNTASVAGGGVYVANGYVVANANIIATNTAANAPDAFGPFATQEGYPSGRNIVGDATGSVGFGDNNLAGTSQYPIDPMIGPLQDNGGPTETHALLPGSPAIDLVSEGGPAVDQRGVARSFDADPTHGPSVAFDVGAFEYVNNGPDAQNDAASTDEDLAVSVDVLANDLDPDNDSLSVIEVSDPAHGSVSVNSDGTISYTPDANFHGTDEFEYTITDGKGTFSTAGVTIAVDPVNDYPEAVDAVFAVDENSPNGTAVGTVVASDVDGEALSFALSGPDSSAFAIDSQSGQISVADAALLDFETHPQFDLEVLVSDGNGGQATANVRVDLKNVLEVAIDILPDDPANQLSAKSKKIEVAILGSAELDPYGMIDLSTVRLAALGSTTSVGIEYHHRHGFKVEQRDVDGDGILDLVLTFKVSDLNLQTGSTSLQLSGSLHAGVPGNSFSVEQPVTIQGRGGGNGNGGSKGGGRGHHK